MTMFDPNERDMIRTLGTMAETAIQRCKHNRVEAREVMQGFIRNDRRFDGYDPAVLARRVEECRSNSAKLDLTDPRLWGQPARPLARDTHW
jgi:hypothetical protein